MLSWRRFFLLIAAIFVATPVFALEWYKAYERGSDKIKGGNCAEGLPLIQEALQTNPRDDLRAQSYGTQVMEYFPHYYLAVCAFRAGKGIDAARFLKEAESARISSSKLAGEFQGLKPQVEALQKQQVAQTTKPEQPPQEQTPQQQKPPQPQPQKPPEQKPVEAKPDNTLLIRTTLQQARNSLNQGRYDDAKNLINNALQLDPTNRDAKALLNDLIAKQAAEAVNREKQQKFNDVKREIDAGNLENAEKLAQALKVLYPNDDRVNGLMKQIQDASNSQVDQAAKNVEAARQAELQKGVEHDVLIAYYRGEYDQAIRLANLGLPKAPQSWRLHFFLGCSYAALAILDENGSEDRLRLARESFRRARSVSHSFTMPPYISPKILEIYRSS
jgi:tetratricopeptide (TPR) repeat protein